MDIRLRLQTGGAYTADIASLRDSIRANGTKLTLANIIVSHPKAKGAIKLLMNLAYNSNAQANIDPANASLYILGFINGNNTYLFNLDPTPYPNLQGTKLNSDGSYPSLGYNFELPSITDDNLASSIDALINFNQQRITRRNAVAGGLTRLIIACSEAIRFNTVENGVNNAISGTPYETSWALVHNWNGLIGTGDTQGSRELLMQGNDITQGSRNLYSLLDFKRPVTDFLEKSILTPKAQGLLEGDLYALAWNSNTPRTKELTVTDLQSIQNAQKSSQSYQNDELYTSTSPYLLTNTSREPGQLGKKIEACCCCTCAPCCCCTAVSVTNYKKTA